MWFVIALFGIAISGTAISSIIFVTISHIENRRELKASKSLLLLTVALRSLETGKIEYLDLSYYMEDQTTSNVQRMYAELVRDVKKGVIDKKAGKRLIRYLNDFDVRLIVNQEKTPEDLVKIWAKYRMKKEIVED